MTGSLGKEVDEPGTRAETSNSTNLTLAFTGMVSGLRVRLSPRRIVNWVIKVVLMTNEDGDGAAR